MKVIILLVFLIFSILSYANDVDFLKLLKRNISFNLDNFEDNISKECENEYKNSEYFKCFPETEINLSNYKNVCSDINSEKCQIFYKDPLKYYPICKEIPAFNELYQPNIIKTIQQYLEFMCLTDEDDNLCPYSLYLITKQNNKNDNNNNNESDKNEIIDVFFDQCESKKCTESMIEFFENMSIDQYAAFENSTFSTGSFTYQELNAKNNMIDLLESDECYYLHSPNDDTGEDDTGDDNDADDDTSGGISIKTNYLLIILYSLLLILSV